MSRIGTTPSSAVSKGSNSKDTQDSEPAALWCRNPAARIDSACECKIYAGNNAKDTLMFYTSILKEIVYSLPPLDLM